MDAINATIPSSPETIATPPGLSAGSFLGKRTPPWESTPYATQGIWSFYHAAAWHHHVPDARITLHPAYLVSLYDPSYSSLAANNKLPVRKHRLTDLSPENITTFKVEVTQALTGWRDDPYGSLGSGIDWSAIAQAVVDRNGDRISEMRYLLDNISSATDIIGAVRHVRLIAFALVMPYIDHPSVLSSNACLEARLSSLGRAAEHCTTAFTRHLETLSTKLTRQELRLKSAIEGVLKRTCNFGTSVLGDSLTLLEILDRDSSENRQDEGRQMLKKWGDDVKDLMDWLGWAMWQRCPRACAWDVRLISASLSFARLLTMSINRNNVMCQCGQYIFVIANPKALHRKSTQKRIN